MKIPWQSLSPQTLDGLIQEFVTRDGTDYGLEETPICVKIESVRTQLIQGVIYISYDEDTESCTILPQHPPNRL